MAVQSEHYEYELTINVRMSGHLHQTTVRSHGRENGSEVYRSGPCQNQ